MFASASQQGWPLFGGANMDQDQLPSCVVLSETITVLEDQFRNV